MLNIAKYLYELYDDFLSEKLNVLTLYQNNAKNKTSNTISCFYDYFINLTSYNLYSIYIY